MSRRAPSQPHALVPALTQLGAGHRRVVAAAIGAGRDTPEALAAVLTDPDALASIVAGLSGGGRALVTQLAFARASGWAAGRGRIADDVATELERHGLLLRFETHWGATPSVPAELEEPLRRVRAAAHAAAVPDGPPVEQVLHLPEQGLHDAAAVASVLAQGGIQLKADGGLYARAVPKLLAALPPLGLVGDPQELRLDLAMGVLRESGALRVRDQGLPGANAKRELALARDPVALLDVPADERRALMADGARRGAYPGRDVVEELFAAFAGRAVALEGVGDALTGLFLEAAKQLPDDLTGASEPTLALIAITERWLRSEAGIGLDADGAPVAIVFTRAAAPEAEEPPCLLGADFELIAMRPVSPAERARLLAVGEPVPGREHVTRVTKERVVAALRSSPDLDVVAALSALATGVPQNVAETVRGWAATVPGRARLRSALFLSAPDEAAADRLAFALGDGLVERLAPTLLAVDAGALTAVRRAVKAAGIELEDGLDRVSGAWTEPPARQQDPVGWRPASRTPAEASVPAGRLRSGLERASAGRGPRAGEADPGFDAAAELRRLLAKSGLDASRVDTLLDELDEDPDDDGGLEDLLLTAEEERSVVRLNYMAAQGVRREWVTIQEVDLEEARVQVRDHATGKRGWRWLRAIAQAEIVR